MAASSQEITANNKENEPTSGEQSLAPYEAIPYKKEIVPHKLIFVLLFHAFAIYGCTKSNELKWQSHVFAIIVVIGIALGVLVGAHRLWAHRTFQANTGLRLFLAFFFTMSFQESVHQWVRDHRCHHKWTDTDADPYNARRGFFFSHVGWIFLNKHPEVLRKGKTIDMSDIEGDPILAFQRRWYWPLLFLIWGFIPTFIPVYFWDESVFNSFLAVIVRTVTIHNITWLVNSWAHMYGNQPYDKRITPVEASIRHLLVGEGFHNFHHAFPWDYSASELGPGEVFNPPTVFINFFHWMGWASNLKRANVSLIEKKKRTIGGKGFAYTSNLAKEWTAGMLTVLTVTTFLPLTVAYSFNRLY